MFVSGFDLEAAEAIARKLPVQPIDVLEVLASLVEKSLIQVTGLGEERVCYSLLESIREYGRELLEEHGELEAVRLAHTGYYIELAERAEPQLRAQGQDDWLSRLEQERDNLDAAMQRLLERDENENALRIAAALGYFWVVSGRLVEGRQWLNHTLSKAADAHPAVRSRALAQAGLILIFTGDYRRSQEVLEEALRLASEIHASNGIARSITYLSLRAAVAGDWDESSRLLQEALDCWRQLDNLQEIGFALRYLVAAAFIQQAYRQAASLLSDAVDGLHAKGEIRTAGLASLYLALTVRTLGELPRAVELVLTGIQASVDCQDKPLLSLAVDTALRLVGDQAQVDTRARLSGARDALNQAAGVTQSIWDEWSARRDERIRAQLEREGQGALYEYGRSLSFAEVGTLTTGMLEAFSQQLSSSKPPSTHAPQHNLLTEREFEVLQLVAEGLSSKAIGERLVISVSTVNYHLTSIFNKLGVDTRAQAVAIAVRKSLL